VKIPRWLIPALGGVALLALSGSSSTSNSGLGGLDLDLPGGPRPDAGIPQGKGLTAPSVYGRTPDEFAEEMASLGMQWVSLAGRKGPNNPGTADSWYFEELPKYADALRARGIDVVIYGWVTSGNWYQEAKDLIASADRAGAIAIRINPEVSWTPGNKTQRENATALMDILTDRYPVIVSSYGGGPKFFGSGFPWAEFAAKAAVGSPQLYGQVASYKARNARIQSWRDAGFSVIHPTVGAGDSPKNIIAEALATPHDGAIAIWSYGNIRKSPARKEAVASLSVGPTSTTSAYA
jgi:hypothetical protein